MATEALLLMGDHRKASSHTLIVLRGYSIALEHVCILSMSFGRYDAVCTFTCTIFVGKDM